MQGNITNLQYRQAHQLLIEYQRIQAEPESKDRLQATQMWIEKANEYGKNIELKKVG